MAEQTDPVTVIYNLIQQVQVQTGNEVKTIVCNPVDWPISEGVLFGAEVLTHPSIAPDTVLVSIDTPEQVLEQLNARL